MKTKKKPIPSIFSTGTEDDICVYCKEYRNRPDPKGRFTINATFMGLPACHSCRMSYFFDGEDVQKRMIAIHDKFKLQANKQ